MTMIDFPSLEQIAKRVKNLYQRNCNSEICLATNTSLFGNIIDYLQCKLHLIEKDYRNLVVEEYNRI